MSSPVFFQGTVDLKPDTTARQIMELADQSGIELSDEVIFQFQASQFTYTVDFADVGWDFVDVFEGFLKDVADKYAAAGWISFEGHEPDQIQVAYGPTERSKLVAEFEQASLELRSAIEKFNRAVRALEG